MGNASMGILGEAGGLVCALVGVGGLTKCHVPQWRAWVSKIVST